METTIQKWGNNCAIQIPKLLLKELGLKENDKIEITTSNNEIVIKKLSQVTKKTLTLNELLANVTEENKHKEVDWGKQEGNEAW